MRTRQMIRGIRFQEPCVDQSVVERSELEYVDVQRILTTQPPLSQAHDTIPDDKLLGLVLPQITTDYLQ